jgi:hypothetical protein
MEEEEIRQAEENRPQDMETHPTATTLVKAPSGEFDAGTEMPVVVEVACSLRCDLQGQLVRILDEDGLVVKEMELVSHEEPAPDQVSSVELPPETLSSDASPSADASSNRAVYRTEEFQVKAPIQPREYAWSAVFPAQEKDGVLHETSTASFSFVVKPHSTSMTVWDIPTPVGQNEKFTIKAGVLCSAGCALAGTKVQVFDERGTRIATGTLNEAPWSNAGPLYWAEIPLQAPDTIGLCDWSVKFAQPEDGMAHLESGASFAFMTAKPPEHVVTVQVVDKDKGTPVANADVALLLIGGAPYRARTDANGMARLYVPKGKYKLGVVMMDYKDYQATVEVQGDATFPVQFVYYPDLGG